MSNDVVRQRLCVTNHCPDGCLLRRGSLLNGIIDHQVQEDIESAESTANFPPSLQMDE